MYGLLSFRNQILYNKKSSIYIATLRYFKIGDNLHLIHKVNYSVETQRGPRYASRPPSENRTRGDSYRNKTHSNKMQPPLYTPVGFSREKGIRKVEENFNELHNEYIQIDIWTNGSLSPRQSLLNAFKKLFEIFYTLSKDNFIKPIGFGKKYIASVPRKP